MTGPVVPVKLCVSCAGAARRQGVRPGSFLSLLIAQAQKDVELTEQEIAIQVSLYNKLHVSALLERAHADLLSVA